jgi:ABC-type transport system involved in multi-copper enzyme maturation permease subunit
MTAHAETFPRAGLPRLARIELRKMADTRAGFWLLLIIELVAAAIVAITVIAGEPKDQNFHDLFKGTLWVVSILLPVLGILAVTSEWGQRTGLTTFALVPERGRVIAAKLLAATALAVYAVVACLLTAALGNAIAGGSWDMPLYAVAHGFLFELVGVLGGVAFGLVFMQSALAIVLYFILPTAWAILFETIHALDKPADWLDTDRTLSPLIDGGMTATAWAHLGTSLALWLGAFLVAGLWRLRRTELK